MIDAVLVGDVPALERLVRFRDVACTTVQGLGGPPKCWNAPNAPPDGTVVSAFPTLHCEGGWLFDAAPVVESLASQDYELHSVYELSLSGPLFGEPEMPSPQHAVVLSTSEGLPPEVVYVQDGAIILTQVSCDPQLPPAMMVERLPGEHRIILRGTALDEPRVTPTATTRPGAATAPSGTRTGEPGLDAVIAAVESNDPTALASLFKLQEVPCTWATGLGGPPKCEFYAPGAPEGTPVSVFAIAGCEGHWGDDPQRVAEIFLEGTPELFAVLEVQWPYDDFPIADNAIMYEWDQGRPGSVYTLFLNAGEIVAIDSGCGLPPAERLDGGFGYGDYEVVLRGPAYE